MEDAQELLDTNDLVQEKWQTKLFNIERENEKLREKLHDKNRYQKIVSICYKVL